jgi:hypothetical protein
MQTGRLIVKRPNQYADKIRRYRIYVDGLRVGTLKALDELPLDVSVGEHEVVARIDWCRSNVLKVNVRTQEPTEVEVSSNAMNGAAFLVLYYITFGYSKYLSLRLAQRGFAVLPAATPAR